MSCNHGYGETCQPTWMMAFVPLFLLFLVSVHFIVSLPRPAEQFDNLVRQRTYAGRPLWCRQGTASLNWSVGNPIIASKDKAMLCREFERELLYFYKVPEDDRRVCRVIDGEIFCYYPAEGVE